MNKEVLKQLEDIVNRGIADSLFPVVTKNSVRIRNMIVRKSKRGYLVIDAREGKQLAFTEFKSTALAIAKSQAKGINNTDKLLDLEQKLSKHYYDAMFFENTINKTKDSFVKETRQVRLEIALAKSQEVRREIDYFIFS
jgi:hypothetical protein